MPTTENGPFFISGVVATIHIEVSDGNSPFNKNPDFREDPVYRTALGAASDLRGEIENAVRATLGDEFYIEFFEIRPGSIHLLITIGATAFAIYEGTSRYKNFVESLTLLTNQIKDVARRVFGRNPNLPNLNVRGSWTPSPSVASAGATLASKPPASLNPLLIWYVIVSHAALLGTFIWLVIRHVK